MVGLEGGGREGGEWGIVHENFDVNLKKKKNGI